MDTLDKNWQNLADAIVIQVAEDYKTGLLSDVYSEEHKFVEECENFFDSEFYHLLTRVKGDVIMKKTKEIVDEANAIKVKKLLKKHPHKERIEKFMELMPFIENRFLLHLIEYGFFSAPASTRFHGNYEGGLFDHSYQVAQILAVLTERNHLKWSRPESPLIIGMFHDLCKMDAYIIEDGEIKHNPDLIDKGHGDRSTRLLYPFLDLTTEERACIKYHMGAFTEKELWSEYTYSIKLCPNVLWTHHADMIASHIKGV